MSQPDSLLLLSGGIDSVQVLHARCVAGLATRTHFVRLSNWEGRANAESRAVRAALAWFRRKGFGHLITHTESSFNYGGLRYVVRDHNIWGLMAGIILANPKNAHITKVLRTFHRDSVRGGRDSAHGRAAERAWAETVTRIGHGDIEFVYPQEGMTKGEIMSALPDDLLALTWYCRRPLRGQPCHECHTCKQVDAARAGTPRTPLDGGDDNDREVSTFEGEAIEGDFMAKPPVRAAKTVWLEYARALGHDVGDTMTKAELIELVE